MHCPLRQWLQVWFDERTGQLMPYTFESREAVMSLTSLCLIEESPPVGHGKY